MPPYDQPLFPGSSDYSVLCLAEGVDRMGEIAGMGLMGLGGLVSVIGGILFLVIAWHSIRRRPR